MIDKHISAALSMRTQTLNLPTQWENTPFTPKADQLYLSENYLPAETDPIGVSSDSAQVFNGIYQISIHCPAGKTKAEGLATADLIRQTFNRGLRLTRAGVQVTIQRTVSAPGFKADDRWIIPVSVYFRAFH
jgi:hypothetical protein